MLTLSEEQKFHLIFAQGSESSGERAFQGTKVPGSETLLGAKVCGNESSITVCLKRNRHGSSAVLSTRQNID